MGLDTVELVMAIEKEFGIEISNADAARLAILGDISDHIVAALRQRAENPDESQIWQRLSALVVTQLGVRPEQITRATHVVKDLGAD
jgi:acyl carrier protein